MVQRSYSTLKSSKVRAFTLLESLIALIVISVGLLLFQAMGQLLISEVRYQQQSEQKEWLLFVDQLEAELERSQFEKVEGNRLYMKQDGKDISIGKSKSDDFRKTDTSGRGLPTYSLWTQISTDYRGKPIGSLSLPISKGLRKGVHLSCGKSKKLRQAFSYTQSLWQPFLAFCCSFI